jgi:ankyrin repeat protein
VLLRAGADANAANDLGATPLWLAAQNGSAVMTRRLLQAGANPNKALLAGETPLMVAARAGSAEVVDLLAAKGANVNAHATRGQTALMWAVAQKHPAVVKVLIARGADIHARSDAWSQVMAVFPHGILDYNRPVPHGQDTAAFAARAGGLESAKLLVDAGARVNDEDAWGVSATVLAAHSGFASRGVPARQGRGSQRRQAGHRAAQAIMRHDEKMVAALLAHGADADASAPTPMRRSSRDGTRAGLIGAPLWLAARFAQPDLMRFCSTRRRPAVHWRAPRRDPAEPRSFAPPS